MMDVKTSANIFANVISEPFTDEYINARLPQLPVESNSRTIVVNAECRVLYDSGDVNNLKGKFFIKGPVTNALSGAGKDTSLYSRADGEASVEVCVPVIKNARPIGAVYMLASGGATQDVLDGMRRYVLYISLFIILAVGLFSASMASALTRPVIRLTKFINSLNMDNLQKVPSPSKDEIGQLADAFNALIDRMAELEDKRKSFVSDASHELKTPISIIKLLCDAALQTPNFNEGDVKEFLEDMNSEAERLSRIIERLLNLTKMDSASRLAKFERASLLEAARGVYEKLKPLADSKGVAFFFEAERDVELNMQRDALTEAIYNIADNCIKYTESGGTVTLSLSVDLGNAVIAVTDTGVGIPKDDLPKIFDRFYRADKARARDTGGAGLGLSIALDAVKLMGGYIEVASEEDAGSKFTIVLPHEE
jgi:signal transduction histidine kinase